MVTASVAFEASNSLLENVDNITSAPNDRIKKIFSGCVQKVC